MIQIMKTNINNNEFPKQLSYQIAYQMPEAPYECFLEDIKAKYKFIKINSREIFLKVFFQQALHSFPVKIFTPAMIYYMVC